MQLKVQLYLLPTYYNIYTKHKFEEILKIKLIHFLRSLVSFLKV